MSHFLATQARLFPGGEDGRRRAELAGLGALRADLDAAERQAQRRRAAGDQALYAREVAHIAELLRERGVCCARWKGASIAALWPEPWMRPVGDLDLLVAPEALESAAGALCARGYRRAPVESDGRFRRGASSLELLPPAPGRVVVDLHARPFRSVGHGLSVEPLLARASQRGDEPLLELAFDDQALLVLVHAAKHGLAHPKWRLDVAAVADQAPSEALVGRAGALGLGRAVRAVLAAVGACPEEAGVSARVLAKILQVRAPDTAPDRLPRLERYLLELLLEESLGARLRMGLGFIEAKARSLVEARS